MRKCCSSRSDSSCPSCWHKWNRMEFAAQ